MQNIEKIKIFDEIYNITDKLSKKPIRDGYGDGLLLAGEVDQNIVVLCADLTESTRSLGFAKNFQKDF